MSTRVMSRRQSITEECFLRFDFGVNDTHLINGAVWFVQSSQNHLSLGT